MYNVYHIIDEELTEREIGGKYTGEKVYMILNLLLIFFHHPSFMFEFTPSYYDNVITSRLNTISQ